MYDGAGRISGRSSGEGLSTGTHLQISNLDFGVTESDIKVSWKSHFLLICLMFL